MARPPSRHQKRQWPGCSEPAARCPPPHRGWRSPSPSPPPRQPRRGTAAARRTFALHVARPSADVRRSRRHRSIGDVQRRDCPDPSTPQPRRESPRRADAARTAPSRQSPKVIGATVISSTRSTNGTYELFRTPISTDSLRRGASPICGRIAIHLAHEGPSGSAKVHS